MEIEDLVEHKYVSLETFRRDGRGVRTPVWFVTEGGRIYVITRDSTWKVKRLANDPRVRLAPCTFGGKIEGEWILGQAAVVSGDEAERAIRLRKKKYGMRAILAGLATRSKGAVIVYSIVPD